MPAKPQAISAKAKREAVAEAFGNIPVDSENLNFLYSRRHLATAVEERGWRELQYIVELDELEQHVLTVLDRIRGRDGTKIFKEVADRLADSIAASIEIARDYDKIDAARPLITNER